MAKKNLPDDVILEILLRLPVKSLLRFRSVSKLWNSLISDPQFRKSHFDLAAAQTDRILYIDKSEVRSIDFEASFYEDSSSVKLNFPLIFRHFWGSCRGFLLFYDGNDLVVLNPSTGVCKRISYPPISVPNTGIWIRYSWLDFKVASFLHGFGYNPLKDDYLIVLGCFKSNANIAVIRFKIFSFKTNSWKEIEGTHFPNMGVEDGRGGILLNGALHWIASYYDSLAKAIVGFDLIEESSRELPVPDDFNHSLEFCGLEVLGGCLALHATGDDTVKIVEIWTMKEYGVKSSWTKSVVVSLDEIDSYYFSPICFTKGGDIVGQYVSEHDIKYDSSGLVKYNCKGELLELHNYCHDLRGFQVAVYTESLLSLPIDGREGGH